VKKLGILAAALVGLGSWPALAATYIITYTGTVATSTTDSAGFFGAVNASLTGLDFVATFTADDATPAARYTSDPEFTTLIGGPGIPDPGPPPPILPGTSRSPVSATLTINGITQRLADINRFIGVVQKRDNSVFPGADSLQTQVDERVLGANVNTRYLQIAVFSTVNNLFTTSGFGESIDRTLVASDQFNSFFALSNVSGQGGPIGSVSGTFNVSTIKFMTQNAGAVPEPASWAFMIVGLGLVGSALRRRGQKPMFATA
jgi:PEP-CTERM motif